MPLVATEDRRQPSEERRTSGHTNGIPGLRIKPAGALNIPLQLPRGALNICECESCLNGKRPSPRIRRRAFDT